jgi:glycosyltransferase involved in cell wall biosynthesis
MKILHVVPGIEQISGGPSQAAVAICHAINQTGLTSHIATTIDSLDRYQLVNHEFIKNNIFYFNRWKLEYFAFSNELKKWLNLNITNYSIVHIHSFFNYPSHVAATCARTARIPYIIRPAGSLNTWSIQQKYWKKQLWIKLFSKPNLKEVSSFHATSKQEAEHLLKLYPNKQIKIIPLGVDFPDCESLSPRLSEQPLQLLFLSRLNQKKNIPLLLSALKKVVERHIPLTLRIAGKPDPGMENYERELRELVKQMELDNFVNFIGFVEGEQKINELRKSHVFVLPSYDENFGIAVAEAMAYGLPVIISNRVALAEDVITNNAGVVIDCEDVDGLAEAIETFYKDENLRLKMSQQSRCLASRFSWSSTADALIHLYSNILQEKLS